MRLQFNLLPDVKQDYLKAQRSKRTVIGSAMAASGLAIVILIFMIMTVYVINKKKLNDADKDVQKYSQELKAIPNLDKILTVQKQLNTLVGLHQNKHVMSRLYAYLPQVTPINVYMGKVNVDLTTSTLIIDGTTDTQKTINTYVDTLKFTTYKIGGQDTKKKAFTDVKESQFAITDKGASYQLTVQFDPVLFSNSQKVELVVPAGLATTRSVINDPSNALFNGETSATRQQNTNAQKQGGQ